MNQTETINHLTQVVTKLAADDWSMARANPRITPGRGELVNSIAQGWRSLIQAAVRGKSRDHTIPLVIARAATTLAMVIVGEECEGIPADTTCRDIIVNNLALKGSGYAQSEDNRFQNFTTGADLLESTPTAALIGYAAKHMTATAVAWTEKRLTASRASEWLLDLATYMILLAAMWDWAQKSLVEGQSVFITAQRHLA